MIDISGLKGIMITVTPALIIPLLLWMCIQPETFTDKIIVALIHISCSWVIQIIEIYCLNRILNDI